MNRSIELHLDEVQSFLPKEFSGRAVHEAHYELSNGKCLLKFYFDQFESSSFVLLVCDPTKPRDEGMKFLILRHLLNAKERMQSDESRFSYVGRVLSTNFANILQGDFSIRRKYDLVESTFLDHLDEVMSLPQDAHPRQLFDDCDIRWLDEVSQKGG